MAFLGRGKKEDLKLLAEELGLEVRAEFKIADIKNLIIESKNYEEDFVMEQLTVIIDSRKEREEEKKRREEREFEEKKKREEREFEEKKKREEREFEEQKRRKEHEFELEKLRLGTVARPVSSESSRSKVDLRQLIQRFDEKESDISLYLQLFERQAEWAQIESVDWVSHLLGLLPYDVTELIAREPAEDAKKYEHVKNLLLKRFKLSPEKFRQKFVKHQRGAESTWGDYVYELENYCREWVKGLGISTFEQLLKLMVTDQLKRRVPVEIRDHFIDEWMEMISPSDLAAKLDAYENVRGNVRKKNNLNKTEERFAPKSKQKFASDSRDKLENNTQARAEGQQRIEQPRWPKRDEIFEKRRRPQCYECGSYQHIRPQCPKLKKIPESAASVNRIGGGEDEFLLPYTTMGQVNGFDMPILRDSGASIDIVCQKYITPNMFTGEHVWVQQPLDLAPTCLPLAEVKLVGDFGIVITKAAVIRDELDQGRYLLGNRTASLLNDMKEQNVLPCQLNAMQTRRQKQLQRELEEKEEATTELESATVHQEDSELDKNQSFLPCIKEDDPSLSLLKVDKETFAIAQKQCKDLQPLFEKAGETSSADTSKEIYIVKGNLLLKRKFDKTGKQRLLLIIPVEYRERLKALCHEGTSAHLGVTKTKDILARHFFWPKCFQEVENYVRSCDACQRAGKPNDKKKAPMKIVPVIQEVFSKINVDACGPLPVTPTGKKYIITAMCLSSKYPDAVAVTDISSVSVVDALLQIFSRMGFPKEIQCDQGTSFMSALTTEFLTRFGIKIAHSSVYHPQSNPIERFHRTIKRILRVLCLEAAPDWEQHIHSALFALRTVTHESTGFTPAELVHGKNLRTPLTLLYESWLHPPEVENTVVEYVFELLNRLKRCQELAVEKMEEVQSKRKTWYDKNAVKREFKEGDLVLILATNKTNKLAVQWTGPGTILSKISDTNYIVSTPNKKETSQIYHVNLLKPYHSRPELINFLDCSEAVEQPELYIDFPSMESNPNIFNFAEIVQESQLEKRLESCQIQQLQDLLLKYSKAFSNKPGMTHLVEHDIELIDDKSVRAKPYRMSPRQTEILRCEIEKMLQYKVIEVGVSDYTSPMILVEVPGRDPRPCIDYRRLNEVTKTEYFPLPNIEERVELVSSAKFITVLDLAKGYWQIPLSQRSQKLAAFVTSFGSYRPLRMPFGLKNAPYFFSKMMAELLQGCEEFAVPYLDDVAIFSSDWEDHVKHLDKVLNRISKSNLTIKPSKCMFAQEYVKYLGHYIGQNQRRPAELKVQAIKQFPAPSTKTEIRAFLGLAGYYRRYIPMFSVIAAPLTEALKGKNKRGCINWSPECESAFHELKRILSCQPVLYAPDFSREFLLQTDASDLGMGIVLSQVDDQGEEHPVLFLSKKFSETERRYSTTEKECAAIVWAVKKLHCYLDGQKFKIQTDHNPLVWLSTNASSNPRLMRWALGLQPYNYEVVHRRGTLHKNADSLSHVPWPD